MSSETILRYNYRLRPGMKAKATLIEEWGRSRWIWNQMLAARQNPQQRLLKGSDLIAARQQIKWLREGSQNAQEQTMITFSGKGKRNFKKKRQRPSLGYSRNGFRIKDGRLKVKGAIIPVVWHRQLPSEPSSLRIYQDALGEWYASFVVRVTDLPLPEVDGAVGIDWGVSMIATASDSEYDFESPQFTKTAAEQLAKYQQRMARRKPKPGQLSSKGYQAAKKQTARLHKKVARQRQHAAQQWARKVVAGNQLIAVEDFKSKFLGKTRMARKAADNAVGQTKSELIQYALRAGREVAIVPAAYTTMTCSNCLTKAKQRLPLSKRIFLCHFCGFTADRDRNAARVILDTAEKTRASAEIIRQAELHLTSDSWTRKPLTLAMGCFYYAY